MRIENIKTIGLFGANNKTADLCIFFAQLKFEVYLSDRKGVILKKSKENVERKLRNLHFQGINKKEINEIRNRIKITLDLDELCNAVDIVFDGNKFFSIQPHYLLVLNERCKPDAIFAISFSDGTPFERIPELSKPRKIIGIHFYSPFLTSKRVDLIKTSVTSNETVNFLDNFLKSLDIKINYYKTDLLRRRFDLNKFLNQILWFRNQLIKRKSHNKISLMKNLRCMAKYYYSIYQHIIRTLKSPILNLKIKLYRFKIRFNKFIFKKRDDKKLMINLGGGVNYRKHWRILDVKSNWFNYESLFIDYFFDMGKNEPFPFEDESISFFYSSHCLEHVVPEAPQQIFNEVYRCLKPGGAFRLQVPDYDQAYEAYGKNDINFFRFVKLKDRIKEHYVPNIETNFLGFFAGQISWNKEILKDVRKNYETMKKEEFANYYINQIKREFQENIMGAHSNWFNYEKIEKMLKNAGFKIIYPSDYQKSKFPEMRGGKGNHRFDVSGQDKTVTVEAVK